MNIDQIKLLPITEELRDELLSKRKRVKLRTPEAVARRRKYKADKPKHTRIRCQHCNKRFMPKRITKRFCTPLCRNKSNIYEHSLFAQLNIYNYWYHQPLAVKQETNQLDFMRDVLRNEHHGFRR